jgi:hypothetical protein
VTEAVNASWCQRILGPTQTAGGRILTRFSLDEKLRGSFREEADAFSVALGGHAYIGPNELRAMKGLPPVDGGDASPTSLAKAARTAPPPRAG